MPRTWLCPPEGPGPGPTHRQCTGPRPATPRALQSETPDPVLPTSKPAPALKPSSPSSGQTPVPGQLQPAVTGPGPLTSRPTQASGHLCATHQPSDTSHGAQRPSGRPQDWLFLPKGQHSPQDLVSPLDGWGAALGLPGPRLSPPVSQHQPRGPPVILQPRSQDLPLQPKSSGFCTRQGLATKWMEGPATPPRPAIVFSL